MSTKSELHIAKIMPCYTITIEVYRYKSKQRLQI